jgi:peptidoglycan/xylan/chitin deacetylase (PgdA/CDA1 family)
VRRIAADGHQIINHSWDHPSFTGRSTGTAPLSTAERLDQIRRAERTLANLGVRTAPWFRPPYGDTDESVDRDLAAAGYRYDVLWTVDSLGWEGRPPAEVTRRVLDAATPGAIVLLHVGSASTDIEALPDIIAGLRAKGYGFVTVAKIV